MGFEINPYDYCVANKTINGKQCTIVWHIDDFKISHVDEKVVKQVIKLLEKRYGKMATNVGKKHTFVGINFDFTNRGSLNLYMTGHLQDALDAFTEELGSTPTSPVSDFLFDVNPYAKPISEKDRKVFHSVFARLLYIRKRTRPDLQVVVAFLGTRTLKADVDDWKSSKGCWPIH